MRIGIRGPSNLFGHPSTNRIHAVEAELQYWDNHPGASVTKVVFGHFPMSFTASAEQGERYEPVFARHSVSAYICGHLHSKFGKQLWRLHTSKALSHVNKPKTAKHFWEWELGDWKEFRFIRILAIDRGDISFLDIELASVSETPSGFKTSILITYPTDSRSMSRVKEHAQPVRNDINALVFSVHPILNATAYIFDSSRDFKIAEEIPLRPASSSSSSKPLYHAKWNAENYMSSSASRYWLQVHAIDSQGKQTASKLRPFSVEGKTSKFSPSWLAFLVFELQWEQVFHILQWSNISFLILLLCLPKLLNPFMERNSVYQNWAMSASISSSIYQRKFVFRLFWFLIEGSRIKTLWYAMVLYLIYLLTMPWFWGHATSEKGNISKLCFSGWRIQTSSGETSSKWLGIPDLMTITLPFMYFIVTPLFLLIYSFSAERSAAYFHSSKNTKYSDIQTHSDTENNRTFLQSYNRIIRSSGCKICAGWLRKALLFTSAVIACLHLKLASGIMEAHGAAPVALSPAVSWVPSLLLAAAIYSTMKKT